MTLSLISTGCMFSCEAKHTGVALNTHTLNTTTNLSFYILGLTCILPTQHSRRRPAMLSALQRTTLVPFLFYWRDVRSTRVVSSNEQLPCVIEHQVDASLITTILTWSSRVWNAILPTYLHELCLCNTSSSGFRTCTGGTSLEKKNEKKNCVSYLLFLALI